MDFQLEGGTDNSSRPEILYFGARIAIVQRAGNSELDFITEIQGIIGSASSRMKMHLELLISIYTLL